MKNFKDILLEKLKVTTKHTNTLSFTFNDLCNSIMQFVNKNTHNKAANKYGTAYIVYIFKLDYFKDNPLIITNETPIKRIGLQGCKVGSISVNTKTPDHISCCTIGPSITLNNNYAVDVVFDITEETFSQVFDTNTLETLYEILNEEN